MVTGKWYFNKSFLKLKKGYIEDDGQIVLKWSAYGNSGKVLADRNYPVMLYSYMKYATMKMLYDRKKEMEEFSRNHRWPEEKSNGKPKLRLRLKK
jgi:hypothetical protein